ncbi:MAG: type II toxin-antitoxin system VapC family toxin [Cyclobacteriaceae bacterium]
MSGNKILLDTNIIIKLFEGSKPIAAKINKSSSFYVSVIVLGELQVGVNRVVNKQKHLEMLNSFMELATIIAIDETTTLHYGEIVADLYKKGKPIPTNDVWIAATAKQHKLTLITNDKHFDQINSLSIEDWTA